MRKAIGIASFVALVGSVLFVPAALAAPPDDRPQYRVYVFTRGAPTSLSNAAVNAIKDLGKANGFTVQSNGDPTQFTEENLARFRAVILLADSDDALNADQQAAFETYYTNGGGVLAIHSAIETEPDWDFLTDVLGARSSGRTSSQAGTIKVADRVHEASSELPEYWNRTESWYNFDVNVRGFSQSWPRSPRTRSTRTHRAPLPGSQAARWASTTRSPGARISRVAARSTPESVARRRRSRTPCTARTCSGRSDGRPASPTRSIPTAGPRSSRTSSRPC